MTDSNGVVYSQFIYENYKVNSGNIADSGIDLIKRQIMSNMVVSNILLIPHLGMDFISKTTATYYNNPLKVIATNKKHYLKMEVTFNDAGLLDKYLYYNNGSTYKATLRYS